MLSTAHGAEKALNREMLRRILQNIRFLARQGLALRGGGDGEDSNFTQLLRIRAFDCPDVAAWIAKKTNNYTAGDIQNELLQLMAISILRDVGTSIKTSGWYTIMADECSDVSNKEQFVIYIRWIDATQLCEHKDVIGLYHVDAIDAKTLVAAIEDVILRLGHNFARCRGQCYDGASNMTGSRVWNAKVDFSCYIYFVGHIFICWCILFSGCVIFHLLLRIFICPCLIYVFFVQFSFVGANFFLSLLVFSLSMLGIICLVPYFVRRAVFCSAC